MQIMPFNAPRQPCESPPQETMQPKSSSQESACTCISSWFSNPPSPVCLSLLPISSTLSCDFQPLTTISDDLRVISDVFVKLSQEKNIVKEIESMMGACVERSSLEWVCIPQKSLAIACDFWNTNSFEWTPFRTGAHYFFLFTPHLGIQVPLHVLLGCHTFLQTLHEIKINKTIKT